MRLKLVIYRPKFVIRRSRREQKVPLELLIYAYMTKISTCHEIDFAQVSLLKDTENLTFSESNGFQICSKFEETDGHMHTL